jgi:hypothetical protein
MRNLQMRPTALRDLLGQVSGRIREHSLFVRGAGPDCVVILQHLLAIDDVNKARFFGVPLDVLFGRKGAAQLLIVFEQRVGHKHLQSHNARKLVGFNQDWLNDTRSGSSNASTHRPRLAGPGGSDAPLAALISERMERKPSGVLAVYPLGTWRIRGRQMMMMPGPRADSRDSMRQPRSCTRPSKMSIDRVTKGLVNSREQA